MLETYYPYIDSVVWHQLLDEKIRARYIQGEFALASSDGFLHGHSNDKIDKHVCAVSIVTL